MFCPNCGKEVTNDAKFCQYCGFSIDKNQENDNVSKNVKRNSIHRKKLLIGSVIIIAIIILGNIGILVNRSGESDVNSTEVQYSDSGNEGTESEEAENDAQSIASNDNVQNVGLESEEQESVSEITSQNSPSDDMYSIWFDGIEFKILKYLDDDNMLVKFPLSNYMIQAVVPRTLENERYISEYYSESDSSGENKEIYLKLVNSDKEDAIFFAYMQGADVYARIESSYGELAGRIDGEEVYEVNTLNNGTAIAFLGGDSVTWGEYDHDAERLSGYMMVVLNPEEQMTFAMEILSEDENDINKDSFEHVAFRKLTDADYVLRANAELENYDARMETMYQKYKEIVEDSTAYLQADCSAPGENYTSHYLLDLTGDNVPEVIFMGTPRCLAIVGEKNSIPMFGNEILFSNTPNVFYIKTAFQENISWQKYEINTDAEGYLVANLMETLEIDLDGYTLNGENITEKEYLSLLSEIEKTDRPKPRMYDTEEYIASQKGFYRSVQCLTNEFVFDNY